MNLDTNTWTEITLAPSGAWTEITLAPAAGSWTEITLAPSGTWLEVNLLADTTNYTRLLPLMDEFLMPGAFLDCDMSGMIPDVPESIEQGQASPQWTEQ